ncbi:hypothetical protein ACT8ZS_12760 [Paenibacillus sp. M.A.Huq-84]
MSLEGIERNGKFRYSIYRIENKAIAEGGFPLCVANMRIHVQNREIQERAVPFFSVFCAFRGIGEKGLPLFFSIP